MWLSAVLQAFLTGIAVFISLELHAKVTEVRRVNGGKLSVKMMTESFSSLMEDQKAEFLPPMTDEEYEEHMTDASGRGELIKKVLSNLSWKSKEKNSQSSDS